MKRLLFFALTVVLALVMTSAGTGVVKADPDWLSDWGYRRAITLSLVTPGADYQVLVTLTTAIMGNPYANVNADGSDIRFTGSDETTLQDYWIESWDNTGTSKIWVEVKTSGTSTIYMYYGNPSAAPGGLSWSGNFILMFQSVPSGWTQFSSLDGRFARGNTAYGGTGGSETHSHSFGGTTGTPSATTSQNMYFSADDPVSYPTTTHTHSFSGTTDSASSLHHT